MGDAFRRGAGVAIGWGVAAGLLVTLVVYQKYLPDAGTGVAGRLLLLGTFAWTSLSAILTSFGLQAIRPRGWAGQVVVPAVCILGSYAVSAALVLVIGTARFGVVSGSFDLLGMTVLAKLEHGLIATAFFCPIVVHVAEQRLPLVATLVCTGWGVLFGMFFVLLP